MRRAGVAEKYKTTESFRFPIPSTVAVWLKMRTAIEAIVKQSEAKDRTAHWLSGQGETKHATLQKQVVGWTDF